MIGQCLIGASLQVMSPELCLSSSNKKLSCRRDSIVDFSVDDVHSALRLAFNSFNTIPNRLMTNREMAIHGHSRLSFVVPIDATYMTSC